MVQLYIAPEKVEMIRPVRAIDMIAQRAGNAAGGTSGVQILMGQPLSSLHSFLPQEKKDELTALIHDLNR